MRDRIEGNNWHLDVDSVEPLSSIMYIRKSVHFIEPHASWVQIDVNQFGLYYLAGGKSGKVRRVRKD